MSPSANPAAVGGAVLSGQQERVLELLAQGFGRKEIAGRLRISVNTVKKHARNCFRRLGAKSPAQAVFVYYCSNRKSQTADER